MAEWLTLMASLNRAIVMSPLGELVTYTPSVGPSVIVRGAFDETYVRVDLGQAGGSSTGPVVFLLLDDLPAAAESDSGATVTFKSRTYTVWESEPDGKGGLMLYLRRES